MFDDAGMGLNPDEHCFACNRKEDAQKLSQKGIWFGFVQEGGDLKYWNLIRMHPECREKLVAAIEGVLAELRR